MGKFERFNCALLSSSCNTQRRNWQCCKETGVCCKAKRLSSGTMFCIQLPLTQLYIFSPLLSTVLYLYLLCSSFLTLLFISPRCLYCKNSNVCTWKGAAGLCTHRDTHTGHTNTHSNETHSHAHSHIHAIARVLPNFECFQGCAGWLLVA
jgi:hypothetical protein